MEVPVTELRGKTAYLTSGPRGHKMLNTLKVTRLQGEEVTTEWSQVSQRPENKEGLVGGGERMGG